MRKAIFCRIKSGEKQLSVGSGCVKSNFLSDRVLEFRQKIAGQKKVPTKKKRASNLQRSLSYSEQTYALARELDSESAALQTSI